MQKISNSKKFSSPALGFIMSWWFGGKGSVSQFINLKSKEPPQTFFSRKSFRGCNNPTLAKKSKKYFSTKISYHLWSYELDLWVWLSCHKYAAWNVYLKIFLPWNLARFDIKAKKYFQILWPACSCQLHQIYWSSKVISKQWNNIFLCWWSLQRGQLKKSPCRCKKNIKKYKERKNCNFCKTWLTGLSVDTIHL